MRNIRRWLNVLRVKLKMKMYKNKTQKKYYDNFINLSALYK